ncbi:MAG: hypothetical protein Q7T81_00335 [Pseudolabrys sp.]|nr:hypothetical protein [Pseudolabrys sp.]
MESTTSLPAPHVPAPPSHEPNFVVRHWRGLLPLWVSYWVVNVIVGVASSVIVVAIVAIFRSDAGYQPLLLFSMFFLIWTLVAGISVWQIVGLWRSANRHAGGQAAIGKGSFWARAAQVATIIMALNVTWIFFKDGVPQLTHVTRIAFMGDPDIAPYSLRTMRGGTEAEISGGFKYGLTSDFSKLLKEQPQIKVVHLHSGGGRIGEAKKLYDVLKNNGLTTYVSYECSSACALAFAGGKERFIARRASLGFHAPSFPGMTANDMKGSIDEQSGLFIKAGFSPVFVSRALNTPASTLWKPTIDELVSAKAVTGIADNARFAVSGYGGDVPKDQIGAALVKLVPLIKAIKQKYPARYESMLDGFYKSYIDGDTESEQNGKVRKTVLSIVDEFRPTADDDVIVDYGRLQVDSYRHLGARDATACYYYASGAGGDRNFTQDLGPALIQRERDVNERIVLTAAPRSAASEAEMKTSFSKMFMAPGTPKLTTDERVMLKADNVAPDKHAAYCRATIKFYSEVLALPPADAVRLLRVMFKSSR